MLETNILPADFLVVFSRTVVISNLEITTVFSYPAEKTFFDTSHGSSESICRITLSPEADSESFSVTAELFCSPIAMFYMFFPGTSAALRAGSYILYCGANFEGFIAQKIPSSLPLILAEAAAS